MPFRLATGDFDNPCGAKRFTDNPECRKFVQGACSPNEGLSKNGTENYPNATPVWWSQTRSHMSRTIVRRALFLFFFQRLMTGAAMAGGEIDARVETGDHEVAERAMRLGFQ